MKYIGIIALVVVIASAVTAGDYRTTKNLSLDAAGIESLEVEAGNGFMEIIGREDIEEIRVTVEIIFEGVSEDEAERIIRQNLDLSLRKDGDLAVLESKLKNGSWFFNRYRNTEVNLTIEIPRTIRLYVDHGSGSMEVTAMNANIEIDDGSGSLKVTKIAGDVEVYNSSGSTEIGDVEGRLRLVDKSGSISVYNITGDVDIKDKSGSMTVKNIGGNVRIKDGSGSIDVEDVEQNVTILESGSGGVHISDVRGKISRYDD